MAKRKKKSEQITPESPEASPAVEAPIDDESPVETETDVSADLTGQAPDDVSKGFENRSEPRVSLGIRTVVQFKESEEESWKEVIDIVTVSKHGAGLELTREVPVGRLISLVMEMPREMRLYDEFAAVYPVLGIVQNCTEAKIDGRSVFHVGVAFLGKKMPDGFKNNPKQCYRISGLGPTGLWNVVEAKNTFKARKYSRFWRRLEVAIAIRDEKKKSTQRHTAFTRDISYGGMSVWGPLDAKIGDRVKITAKDPEFYSMATVRNRTEHPSDPTRSMLHFEFEGAEYPVDKINFRPPATVDEAAATEDITTLFSAQEDDVVEDDGADEVVRF